ncbi:isocitrate lyase/PEP mutase family protein [Ramlibacter sp.]|uniref:isocitrate lyase/PEP mutase family protein n=1 Tax=Ramlibacter sp. TaxID=1917967 RepID=UPI003D123018
MRAAHQLRQLLAGPDMVVAPGAYDCISARVIEQAGFKCAYMTGSGTSAARGYPDLGLVTMSEMVENAAAIARMLTIPLVADADTGYGNELNVHRTVREFEARNVAGIHIEDQVAPKRCGHLDGKEVVSRSEFEIKIRAAVQARTDPDFLIIARTDARAVLGLDEAIERAKTALDVGADMVFVEATENLGEMAQVPRRVGGPCLLNIAAGGKTPLVPLKDAQAMGYRLAILPGMLLRNAIATFDEVLEDLAKTGVPKPVRNMGSIAAGHQRFGTDAWNEIRVRAAMPSPTGR